MDVANATPFNATTERLAGGATYLTPHALTVQAARFPLPPAAHKRYAATIINARQAGTGEQEQDVTGDKGSSLVNGEERKERQVEDTGQETTFSQTSGR